MLKVNVKLEKVTSAYNGKVGCMCGCLGTYAEPEETAKIKRRVNMINKMINTGDYDEVDFGETYIYVEKDGRCTAVYFD